MPLPFDLFDSAERRELIALRPVVQERIAARESQGFTDWIILVYARQSDRGKRGGERDGYFNKQCQLRDLLPTLWSVATERVRLISDRDLSGQIDIRERNGGRDLLCQIESGRAAVVVFDKVDRAFRDSEELPAVNGERVAVESHSRAFSRCCAMYGTFAIAASLGQWRAFQFSRTEDVERFVGDAIEGGREARKMPERMRPGRRRAASQGRNAGGTVRLGYMGLQPNVSHPTTGHHFSKHMILPYLPHAKTVALWQRAALRLGNESDTALLRYARQQTELYLATAGSAEPQGADYRFWPFPEEVHGLSLGSTAFNVMRCHVDPETGKHDCCDCQHYEDSHYVWRATIEEEDEWGNVSCHQELLPWEDCRPVFPTVNMIPCLLMHPIYLGDCLSHGDVFTIEGLFRALPERESDLEDHIASLRKKAEKVNYICHHPYHRLVQGFDEAFLRNTPDAEGLLEEYRSRGLLFDADQVEDKKANNFTDYCHLAPDASWRLSEQEFWRLAEMRCPIDLRRYRGSNYDPTAIEPNFRCERKRGRKIEQRRYTPFQKIAFCASHGFLSQSKDGYSLLGPNPRYRMIRGASQRDFDGIRCPGESQRDRTQDACMTIGADGRVYKVLNHHVQEVLAGLNQDGTLAEMIGERLSNEEKSALLQRKAALEANQDETLERYDLTEREFNETLKNIKSAPLLARARLRHKETIADLDRQITDISAEIERVSSLLTDTIDESLVEDAVRAAENWQQFFDDPDKVERGNALLHQVVNYFAIAAENNSKIQEVIIYCSWVNKPFYIVMWRGKSHERFTFSDAQNAWLVKNYNRKTLRLATIEKHFPGIPYLVIERHARDVLGLRRTDYRGKSARNLKAEWFAKHGSWTRQNKDILYGVLDAHPLKAQRIVMYGKNGETLGTQPIPKEVKVNLQTLVANRCPDLP